MDGRLVDGEHFNFAAVYFRVPSRNRSPGLFTVWFGTMSPASAIPNRPVLIVAIKMCNAIVNDGMLFELLHRTSSSKIGCLMKKFEDESGIMPKTFVEDLE